MKQDLLIDQLKFSLDCVTSITPISNAAHCTLGCCCGHKVLRSGWLHVFCATDSGANLQEWQAGRPWNSNPVRGSAVLIHMWCLRLSACRSGLSWRPASYRSQGGSERPQASEGHGELRLEHHRPQGEMNSSTPGIKEPSTILGD